MFKLCAFFTFVLIVACERKKEVKLSRLGNPEGNGLINYFREESSEDWPSLRYATDLESSVLKYLECLWEEEEEKEEEIEEEEEKEENDDESEPSEPFLTAAGKCRRENFQDKTLVLHGTWTGNATAKKDILQAVKESWKEEVKGEEKDVLEDLERVLLQAKGSGATSFGCGYGYDETLKMQKLESSEEGVEEEEEEGRYRVSEEKESGYSNSRRSVNMGPKLYTVGSGFLETHVTWEDIESALLNDRKLKVKFGPNKNVQQVGEGIGFMSRIAVIDADYQEEVDLPQKFAVKIVTLLPSLGMAKSIKERHEQQLTDEEVLDDFAKTSRNNHNREVDIYLTFSKFDISLSKMPQVYFTQKFTTDTDLKGFIGMEFIEDAVVRDISQNLKPDELFEAIDALAYLEAKSLELNDEDKQKVASNPIPVIYPPLIHPKAVSKMIQEMYAAAPELEPAGKVLEEMTADFVDLELTSTLNEELGMQDVFVHGDLWSANLVWTNTANGLSLSGIVDYQLAHFGCPAEDLTRLFISTMSGKERRQNWERLLEKFHECLQKYCTGKLPFTLDQLKESYRRIFPIAGVLLLPTFGNVSEKDNTERKSLLIEKKLALFEDMLFFAKRDQEVEEAMTTR